MDLMKDHLSVDVQFKLVIKESTQIFVRDNYLDGIMDIKLSNEAQVPCAYVVINASDQHYLSQSSVAFFFVLNLLCQPLQETESLQSKIFEMKHFIYSFIQQFSLTYTLENRQHAGNTINSNTR